MTAGSAHLNDDPGRGLRPGHVRIRNTFPVQTTDLKRGPQETPTIGSRSAPGAAAGTAGEAGATGAMRS